LAAMIDVGDPLDVAAEKEIKEEEEGEEEAAPIQTHPRADTCTHAQIHTCKCTRTWNTRHGRWADKCYDTHNTAHMHTHAHANAHTSTHTHARTHVHMHTHALIGGKI